jgi:hypothetical protein
MYFTILHACDATKNYMDVKLRLQAFFSTRNEEATPFP